MLLKAKGTTAESRRQRKVIVTERLCTNKCLRHHSAAAREAPPCSMLLTIQQGHASLPAVVL